MIGYVIFGAAAGAVGGVAHLVGGGSLLGAIGIYSAGGSAGIMMLATSSALAGTLGDRRATRNASGAIRPRAGRVAAARRVTLSSSTKRQSTRQAL